MAKNDEAAKREMKDAHKALDSLPKRKEEDQEYWDANQRVIEADPRTDSVRGSLRVGRRSFRGYQLAETLGAFLVL